LWHEAFGLNVVRKAALVKEFVLFTGGQMADLLEAERKALPHSRHRFGGLRRVDRVLLVTDVRHDLLVLKRGQFTACVVPRIGAELAAQSAAVFLGLGWV